MSEPGGIVVYPAIDLRRGRCVRLEQGAVERETVYDADPRAVSLRFAAVGAEWLHVVDLDAAFGDGSNRELILELVRTVPLRVQVGGGLRTAADVDRMLEGGAGRAVIGTAAIEDPALVADAVRRWGAERIAVGVDARGTRPAVRGWRQESDEDLFVLGARMVDLGVRTLIHTDIDRDGLLGGPNVAASTELARRSGAEVIVSGGVAGVADVRAVAGAARGGVRIGGVIVGKALYEERIGLADALDAARG